MFCPQDHNVSLEKITPQGVTVYRCPKDNGLWFPEENLRELKDEKDPFLRWMDIDPWEDPEEFRLSPSGRVCPVDQEPLYQAAYGDSDITVDVCAKRHGVWLDEGEFRAIIDFLHAELEQETLNDYFEDALSEAGEVVSGPEGVAEEARDFLVVSKLLTYRLLSRFPALSEMIAQLPT